MKQNKLKIKQYLNAAIDAIQAINPRLSRKQCKEIIRGVEKKLDIKKKEGVA